MKITEKRLKILSYNIHKGFSQGNRKFVLNHIRDVLRKNDADVVFLQEVQGENSKHAANIDDWPDAPQFEYLAHELWPHTAYGKNAVYSHGHHGNAILSKYNILSWENIDVSSHPFESRGLLHAVIQPDDWKEQVHLICAHLALVEYGRLKQIAHICARVNSNVPHEAPLIIAGDFNDWRLKSGQVLERNLGVTEVHKAIHGKYARTFPSNFPLLKLDRIYTRKLRTHSAASLTGKPWSELSDHAPLESEVSLNQARRGEAEPHGLHIPVPG